MNAQSPLVAHDPGRANRPEIDTQADTQSDTLRSGRPCDSWTPSEAKVRDSLSKTHRWTPPDAGGTAGTDLLIRVSLVRSQRGPPIESIAYEGAGRGIHLVRVQIGSNIGRHSPSPAPRAASSGPASDCVNLRSAGTATTRVSAGPAATIPRRTTTQGVMSFATELRERPYPRPHGWHRSRQSPRDRPGGLVETEGRRGVP